jgi:AcrR family transcriptional regulator
LTRAGIVATALAIMRAEGAERVTMRRLAKELDTGPASLYVYLRDTDEQHAAVLDSLLADVDFSAGAGDWRERLWSVLSSYRDVLYANPSLARVALVTRLSGRNYLSLVDTLVGLLLAGGMAARQAAWAVDYLLLNATASAVEHGTRRERPGGERDTDALVAALDSASGEDYPGIAAVGAELLSGTGLVRSRWAFDTFLNGVLATPVPPVS